MTRLVGRPCRIATLLSHLTRNSSRCVGFGAADGDGRLRVGALAGAQKPADKLVPAEKVVLGSTAPVSPAALVSEGLSGGQEPLGS